MMSLLWVCHTLYVNFHEPKDSHLAGTVLQRPVVWGREGERWRVEVVRCVEMRD